MLKAKPEGAEGAEVTSGPRQSRLNRLTEGIIGAAIEAHRQTGPGPMESAYEERLCFELSQRGIAFRRQVELPVLYKGVKLDCGYRMDLVIEDEVVVELKTVDRLLEVPVTSAPSAPPARAAAATAGFVGGAVSRLSPRLSVSAVNQESR